MQWFARELIRFGAVHWCPVPPLPSSAARPGVTSEQMQRVTGARAAVTARLGKNVRLDSNGWLGHEVVTGTSNGGNLLRVAGSRCCVPPSYEAL